MAQTVASFILPPPTQTQCHLESFSNSQFLCFPCNQSSRITRSSPKFQTCCAPIDVSVPKVKTAYFPEEHFNSKLRELCDLGSLKNAMELLYMSPKFEIRPKTYCSILQLCADSKSLGNGKRVHSIIHSNGVAVDGLLATRLVFMYVTCGDLVEGRRVFDLIGNDKVFLWNLLINEYAKIGDYKESIYLFRKMLEVGIEPNAHTFSCVFKCFASLGCFKDGECVHGHLLKLRFGCYTSVVNSLVAFYFRGQRVESARELFDEMCERDIISWNSMVSGYVANGLAEKGIEVFKDMLCLGIDVDLATFLSVLAGCASLGILGLGSSVHALAVKTCFDKEVTFNNTLLDVYSKCGDTDSSFKVFERMSGRSIVSWTSMIAGFAREGQSDEGIRLFHQMERGGLKLDLVAITSILHACACSGLLEHGKEVHRYIEENDIEMDLFVSNALMDMYAKCGSMEDAVSVFSKIPWKDCVSWNTMIGGYSKNGLPNEAFELFVAMQREWKLDSVTMACILPACASLSALDRGREVHAYILRNGHSSDRRVANALADMYVKCGVLGLGCLLFDSIPSKDLVSWTVMIAGYGMHGYGIEAIAAFKQMREAGISPDEVSFISILYACSHSGLLKEGWKFYNIMKHEYKIKPKLEHYACVVDLFARTGNLAKAYEFIQRMPITPDATIWGALLCGCRVYHDIELAEKVAEHVFELEPDNTGYYVLLANIYAEAEKWEKVKKMREEISSRGLKKNPGCSWIEIRGKVNLFVSGDSSHPQSSKIESLLRRIRRKMKEDGHVLEMKYALINADEMHKETALCGHSEKLAMAFGLLRLPPGKTIRVTKNLRVCGDCHETAKFISKEAKREIVLRDSSRFHHFKDGRCSCRGFW